MADSVATAISLAALAISAVTAWLVYFRRGTIKATHPTVIYFGPDGGGPRSPKVFLRTLLFSTAKRGRVIESLHVTLARHETRQNFPVWVFGDGALVRGSGLFVGETGISASHHFLAPADAGTFRFLEGRYQLTLVAKLLGDSASVVLLTEVLDVTVELAAALREEGTGLYFDWGPDSGRYLPHIDRRPVSTLSNDPLAGVSIDLTRRRAEIGQP